MQPSGSNWEVRGETRRGFRFIYKHSKLKAKHKSTSTPGKEINDLSAKRLKEQLREMRSRIKATPPVLQRVVYEHCDGNGEHINPPHHPPKLSMVKPMNDSEAQNYCVKENTEDELLLLFKGVGIRNIKCTFDQSKQLLSTKPFVELKRLDTKTMKYKVLEKQTQTHRKQSRLKKRVRKCCNTAAQNGFSAEKSISVKKNENMPDGDSLDYKSDLYDISAPSGKKVDLNERDTACLREQVVKKSEITNCAEADCTKDKRLENNLNTKRSLKENESFPFHTDPSQKLNCEHEIYQKSEPSSRKQSETKTLGTMAPMSIMWNGPSRVSHNRLSSIKSFPGRLLTIQHTVQKHSLEETPTVRPDTPHTSNNSAFQKEKDVQDTSKTLNFDTANRESVVGKSTSPLAGYSAPEILNIFPHVSSAKTLQELPDTSFDADNETTQNIKQLDIAKGSSELGARKDSCWSRVKSSNESAGSITNNSRSRRERTEETSLRVCDMSSKEKIGEIVMPHEDVDRTQSQNAKDSFEFSETKRFTDINQAVKSKGRYKTAEAVNISDDIASIKSRAATLTVNDCDYEHSRSISVLSKRTNETEEHSLACSSKESNVSDLSGCVRDLPESQALGAAKTPDAKNVKRVTESTNHATGVNMNSKEKHLGTCTRIESTGTKGEGSILCKQMMMEDGDENQTRTDPQDEDMESFPEFVSVLQSTDVSFVDIRQKRDIDTTVKHGQQTGTKEQIEMHNLEETCIPKGGSDKCVGKELLWKNQTQTKKATAEKRHMVNEGKSDSTLVLVAHVSCSTPGILKRECLNRKISVRQSSDSEIFQECSRSIADQDETNKSGKMKVSESPCVQKSHKLLQNFTNPSGRLKTNVTDTVDNTENDASAFNGHSGRTRTSTCSETFQNTGVSKDRKSSEKNVTQNDHPLDIGKFETEKHRFNHVNAQVKPSKNKTPGRKTTDEKYGKPCALPKYPSTSDTKYSCNRHGFNAEERAIEISDDALKQKALSTTGGFKPGVELLTQTKSGLGPQNSTELPKISVPRKNADKQTLENDLSENITDRNSFDRSDRDSVSGKKDDVSKNENAPKDHVERHKKNILYSPNGPHRMKTKSKGNEFQDDLKMKYETKTSAFGKQRTVDNNMAEQETSDMFCSEKHVSQQKSLDSRDGPKSNDSFVHDRNLKSSQEINEHDPPNLCTNVRCKKENESGRVHNNLEFYKTVDTRRTDTVSCSQNNERDISNRRTVTRDINNVWSSINSQQKLDADGTSIDFPQTQDCNISKNESKYGNTKKVGENSVISANQIPMASKEAEMSLQYRLDDRVCGNKPGQRLKQDHRFHKEVNETFKIEVASISRKSDIDPVGTACEGETNNNFSSRQDHLFYRDFSAEKTKTSDFKMAKGKTDKKLSHDTVKYNIDKGTADRLKNFLSSRVAEAASHQRKVFSKSKFVVGLHNTTVRRNTLPSGDRLTKEEMENAEAVLLQREVLESGKLNSETADTQSQFTLENTKTNHTGEYDKQTHSDKTSVEPSTQNEPERNRFCLANQANDYVNDISNMNSIESSKYQMCDIKVERDRDDCPEQINKTVDLKKESTDSNASHTLKTSVKEQTSIAQDTKSKQNCKKTLIETLKELSNVLQLLSENNKHFHASRGGQDPVSFPSSEVVRVKTEPPDTGYESLSAQNDATFNGMKTSPVVVKKEPTNKLQACPLKKVSYHSKSSTGDDLKPTHVHTETIKKEKDQLPCLFDQTSEANITDIETFGNPVPLQNVSKTGGYNKRVSVAVNPKFPKDIMPLEIAEAKQANGDIKKKYVFFRRKPTAVTEMQKPGMLNKGLKFRKNMFDVKVGSLRRQKTVETFLECIKTTSLDNKNKNPSLISSCVEYIPRVETRVSTEDIQPNSLLTYSSSGKEGTKTLTIRDKDPFYNETEITHLETHIEETNNSDFVKDICPDSQTQEIQQNVVASENVSRPCNKETDTNSNSSSFKTVDASERTSTDNSKRNRRDKKTKERKRLTSSERAKDPSDDLPVIPFEQVMQLKREQYRKFKYGLASNPFVDFQKVRLKVRRSGSKSHLKKESRCKSRGHCDRDDIELQTKLRERKHAQRSRDKRSHSSRLSGNKHDSVKRTPRPATKRIAFAYGRRRLTSRRSKSTLLIEDIETTVPVKLTKSFHPGMHFKRTMTKFRTSGTGYFSWRRKYQPRKEPFRNIEYNSSHLSENLSPEEMDKQRRAREREVLRRKIENCIREYRRTFQDTGGDKKGDAKVASFLQYLTEKLEVLQMKRDTLNRNAKGMSTNPVAKDVYKFRDLWVSDDKADPSKQKNDEEMEKYSDSLEDMLKEHLSRHYESMTKHIKEELMRQLTEGLNTGVSVINVLQYGNNSETEENKRMYSNASSRHSTDSRTSSLDNKCTVTSDTKSSDYRVCDSFHDLISSSNNERKDTGREQVNTIETSETEHLSEMHDDAYKQSHRGKNKKYKRDYNSYEYQSLNGAKQDEARFITGNYSSSKRPRYRSGTKPYYSHRNNCTGALSDNREQSKRHGKLHLSLQKVPYEFYARMYRKKKSPTPVKGIKENGREEEHQESINTSNTDRNSLEDRDKIENNVERFLRSIRNNEGNGHGYEKKQRKRGGGQSEKDVCKKRRSEDESDKKSIHHHEEHSGFCRPRSSDRKYYRQSSCCTKKERYDHSRRHRHFEEYMDTRWRERRGEKGFAYDIRRSLDSRRPTGCNISEGFVSENRHSASWNKTPPFKTSFVSRDGVNSVYRSSYGSRPFYPSKYSPSSEERRDYRSSDNKHHHLPDHPKYNAAHAIEDCDIKKEPDDDKDDGQTPRQIPTVCSSR